MPSPGRERRKGAGESRRSFTELAHAAIRTRVRASRTDGAHWEGGANLAWVRWPREEGGYVYVSLRRRLDFLTGELGVSDRAVPLEQLPLVDALARADLAGSRIQLGPLVQGHDRWWATGGTETSFVERLDWLAQQLQLRLMGFLSAAAQRS